MSNLKCAFVYSPEIEQLSYPPDCPFKTQRATATRQRLLSFGLLGQTDCFEVPTRQATRSELERFHTSDYLEVLQRAAAGDLTFEGLEMGLGTPDTPVFRDLFQYGAWACGAGITGAELLLKGQADIVFNLLGGFHHAQPEKAAGFCYLNDQVLACLRLTAAGKRVAYLDIDAHHGDGVQNAFYHRNDVFTISMHESGKTLFPWGGFENEIGEGPGRGYNVNVSLPAGTYDQAFLMAFERITVPLLDAYDPDVIVVELGMDTLAGDPLTHLSLTNNVVVDVMKRLMGCERPLLIVGGGGYHVENTVRSWALAWQTCCGEEEEHDLSAGMGGVMLASTEWVGGLRDHVLPVTPEQRQTVEPALQNSIQTIVERVFPHHGLTKLH